MLLNFLWNFIAFIITIGILIIVHECGHFLTARFFKVKVERFSIGFGPVLWGWRDLKGTEYVISLIPLGGYVKLLDTSLHVSSKEGDYVRDNEFYEKCIWKRSAIILAGPIFNFIFSIFLYTVVLVIGVPSERPIVNYVCPGSIVSKYNIPIGCEIKFIDNVQTIDWKSINLYLLNGINKQKIVFSTQLPRTDNNIYYKKYIVDLPEDWLKKSIINIHDPIIALGIFPHVLRVISVNPEFQSNDSIILPQYQLQIGDVILLVNGQPIYNLEFFIKNIQINPNQCLKIVLERNKRLFFLNFKLNDKYIFVSKEDKEYVNFTLNSHVVLSAKKQITQKYEFYSAILMACNKIFNLIFLTIDALFKLISGNMNIMHLHGPIAIAQEAKQFMYFGINYYLMFLVVISVNLGVINLIPFPILDGGQLLFLLIEKILGQSIAKKIYNFVYIICFIMLILIMFLILYNDLFKKG